MSIVIILNFTIYITCSRDVGSFPFRESVGERCKGEWEQSLEGWFRKEMALEKLLGSGPPSRERSRASLKLVPRNMYQPYYPRRVILSQPVDIILNSSPKIPNPLQFRSGGSSQAIRDLVECGLASLYFGRFSVIALKFRQDDTSAQGGCCKPPAGTKQTRALAKSSCTMEAGTSAKLRYRPLRSSLYTGPVCFTKSVFARHQKRCTYVQLTS